jgi:hypothetical protein
MQCLVSLHESCIAQPSSVCAKRPVHVIALLIGTGFVAETFREFFRHGSEIFMPSKEVRRAKKKERTKTRKEYVAC